MVGNPASELELLKKCIEGGKKEWDIFVKNYSNLIYDTIIKTLKGKGHKYSQDETDDLFSEVFLSLLENNYKKLKQFQGKNGCSPSTFIRVIAMRATLDYLRKDKKELLSLDEENEEGIKALDFIKDTRESVYEKLETEESEKMMCEIIDELSPHDQLFVKLYYVKDLPPEEVASVLGISMNAFYSKNSRVSGKMEKIFRKSKYFERNL